VLGVKVTAKHRLPASFFVSLAYECWSCRRWSVELDDETQKSRFTELTELGSKYTLPQRLLGKAV
jgi:tartrate dehydratase alpha subunit/fumarate hydratase class I-like protein